MPAFNADKDPEEWGVILETIRQSIAKDKGRYTRIASSLRGVCEETTTGVHRLYQMMEAGTLLFPAINVNDSVTKSKFDNIYGCRHSLPDGLARATDVMLGGKVAVVFGFGEVGKGLRAGAARPGLPRHRHRNRSDLRAAGGDGRLSRWRRSTTSSRRADIFITATGNHNIITAEHMAQMKDKAIVGNIGHFDNEIDMAGLKKFPGVERINIKPQYDEFALPRRPQRDGARRRTAAEPRLRDRPSELRDVGVVHQPGDRAAGAARQHRQNARRRSTCCRSTSTSRSRGCTSIISASS